MYELFICLIKYTAIFMSMLYAYTKLLRIKLKAGDILDIPIFIAISAALYYVTVYIKILVPIGILISGIAFLLLRFGKTFYETVTVGAISLGLSIVVFLVSFLISTPITISLNFINNEYLEISIAQIIVSILQIAGIWQLFQVKRLQSGIKPKSKDATFDILMYVSVVCIFAMMLLYAEDVKQYMLKVVLLVIGLNGLILIVWWRRHITNNYREEEKEQGIKLEEENIADNEINAAEEELQVAVYAKLFHYLNKAVHGCAILAESAAAQTGNADACEVRDLLQHIMREMNIANEKCSLKNVPQTGERLIDVSIIRMYAGSERKNFKVSTEITADAASWFSGSDIDKNEIHIMLDYLCENAMYSALGLPDAKVHIELSATTDKKPLIRIYDSGEQFDEKVLAKLGLEQITTRAGNGGSGIGMIKIFEIITKYGASFTLDEAPRRYGYTKSIEIAFDGQHTVLVRTYRESAISACIARKGITVERIEETLKDGTNG